MRVWTSKERKAKFSNCRMSTHIMQDLAWAIVLVLLAAGTAVFWR